jgi:hypothetical protein
LVFYRSFVKLFMNDPRKNRQNVLCEFLLLTRRVMGGLRVARSLAMSLKSQPSLHRVAEGRN